jgi:acyl carrier protein
MTNLHLELKQFIIEALNLEDISVDDIGDDTSLFGDDGLGLDSIDALELVLGLKKKYGIVIEAGDEKTRHYLRSVNTLVELIQLRGSTAA